MPDHGVGFTAARSVEPRTVVRGSRVASPPARQSRPRRKRPADTSPLTTERLMRMPLPSAVVLGAVA